MVREILFRAKTTSGVWVEGSLLVTLLNNYIIPLHDETRESQLHYTVLPETIGQFTGLTDKNGVKIFESDTNGVYVVFFENGCFKLKSKKGDVIGLLSNYIFEFEVIGNIHDNND